MSKSQSTVAGHLVAAKSHKELCHHRIRKIVAVTCTLKGLSCVLLYIPDCATIPEVQVGGHDCKKVALFFFSAILPAIYTSVTANFCVRSRIRTRSRSEVVVQGLSALIISLVPCTLRTLECTDKSTHPLSHCLFLCCFRPKWLISIHGLALLRSWRCFPLLKPKS